VGLRWGGSLTHHIQQKTFDGLALTPLGRFLLVATQKDATVSSGAAFAFDGKEKAWWTKQA
jgi:hypothetical protein